MNNSTEKHWQAEFVAWLITLIVVALVIIPISINDVQFSFIYYNLLFIILGVTFTRYLLFFDTHPLAYSRVFKVLLIFVIPVLFFPILEGLHSFIEFNDREGLQTFLTHLSNKKQIWLMNYIRIEYLFFGITSFIGSFLIIIKMIKAFWKQYKFNKL